MSFIGFSFYLYDDLECNERLECFTIIAKKKKKKLKKIDKSSPVKKKVNPVLLHLSVL